jgi:hypothetical protein
VLAVYLIGLAVTVSGVALAFGWTVGTTHDSGVIIPALLCCAVWPLIAVVILIEQPSPNPDRQSDRRRG